MVGVQGEAVGLVDATSEAGQGPVLDVDDRTALVADEVGVAVLAQVVEGRAVAGVHVLDDPELAESLEHAVDGRGCDARSPSLEHVDDAIGRQMTLGLEQDAHDHPRGCRDATTAVTNRFVDHLVARIDGPSRRHNATLTDVLVATGAYPGGRGGRDVS